MFGADNTSWQSVKLQSPCKVRFNLPRGVGFLRLADGWCCLRHPFKCFEVYLLNPSMFRPHTDKLIIVYWFMILWMFMSTTLSLHVISTGNDFPKGIWVVKLRLEIGLGHYSLRVVVSRWQHGIVGLVPMCHVFLWRRFDVWDVNTRTDLKMEGAWDCDGYPTENCLSAIFPQ